MVSCNSSFYLIPFLLLQDFIIVLNIIKFRDFRDFGLNLVKEVNNWMDL